MKRAWWGSALAALAATAAVTVTAGEPITLIGRGVIPGTALDLSGLDPAQICRKDLSECISQSLFGGLGSAVTYTGRDGVFLAVPDRGPFDGQTDVPFRDRFHFLHFGIDQTLNPANGEFNLTTTLLDTRLLTSTGHRPFVGDAYAFDPDPLKTARFDPEGVVVDGVGNFIVSDEYGPYINRFNRQGHLIQRIAVPEKFLIANPSGQTDSGGNSLELLPALNTSGRQANRGMEGLAITPDGRTLVGIMQNALIQDKGLNSSGGRQSLHNRLLTIDLESGTTHEYVYTIDAIGSGRGVNELLALNSHEFLVLERDNRSLFPTPPNSAQTPQEKRLYKIDLAQADATDVSGIAELPLDLATQSIKALNKTLFLDLLSPSFKVSATQTIKDVIAEKVEAMAWGPDLADGRHVLYVLTDNDLYTGRSTQVYAFAIDPTYATYVPQVVAGPMYPPGQVRKAIR